MAKKQRFPLIMDEGVEVSTLEELRENFSVEKVLEYMENGQLYHWLEDRYESEIAEKLRKVDFENVFYKENICKIFGVLCVELVEKPICTEEIKELTEEQKARIEELKKYTDNESLYERIDNVAFDQDELFDLLDEDKKYIYLCGEKFNIPLGKSGVRYIGVNNPKVIISSSEYVNLESRKIYILKCEYDEKYRAILEEAGMYKDYSKEFAEFIEGNFEIYEEDMFIENAGNGSALYNELVDELNEVSIKDFSKSAEKTAISIVKEGLFEINI